MSFPISGYVKPGFEPVKEAFEANFAEGLELGAGFAAIQSGEILVNLRGGYADRKKEEAWTEQTLVPVYSTTKPVAALVIAHLLSGHDTARYDTRLIEFWPEFGAHGKDQLTIGDVLSHQGGLSGFATEIDPALWFDQRGLAQKLAEAEPLWAPVPDGRSGYHPLTWGYLASEIVLRLSGGKTIGTLLAETFTGTQNAAPDIDFWIGTPASEHHRAADIQRPTALAELGTIDDIKKAAFLQKWSAPNRGGAIWRETEIPSANGHGTALSTAELYAMFAEKGVLNGETLIDSDTFHELTKLRASGQDRVLPFELQFGAGVMRNNAGFYGRNPNSLGHSGWGGSAAFGDPDIGLSAAYVMNKQSNKLQGDPRPMRLFEALYACL